MKKKIAPWMAVLGGALIGLGALYLAARSGPPGRARRTDPEKTIPGARRTPSPAEREFAASFKGVKNVEVFIDRPREVVLRVLHGAAPVRVVVHASHRDGAGRLRHTARRTDDQGVLRRRGTGGEYRFRVFADESGYHGETRARLGPRDESLAVRLEVKKALTLVGRVVDGRGRPLAGVVLTWRGDLHTWVKRSGAAGKFSFGGFSDREYRIGVQPDRARIRWIAVRPGRGPVVLKTDVEPFPPLLETRVVVVEHRGDAMRPLAGLRLAGGYRTGPDGGFTAPFSAGSRPSLVPIDLRERLYVERIEGFPVRKGTEVRLVMAPRIPLLLRLSAGGKPLKGALVFRWRPELLLDKTVRALLAVTPSRWERRTIEGLWNLKNRLEPFHEIESGVYRGPLVRPDRAEAVYLASRGHAGARVVLAASVRPVPFRVLALHQLRGLVLWRGQPFGGAVVRLRTGLSAVHDAETVSSADGCFGFARVPEGKHRVYALVGPRQVLVPGARPPEAGWGVIEVTADHRDRFHVTLRESATLIGTVAIDRGPDRVLRYLQTPYDRLVASLAVQKQFLPRLTRRLPPDGVRFVVAVSADRPEGGPVGFAPLSERLHFVLRVPPGRYRLALYIPFGKGFHSLGKAEVEEKQQTRRFHIPRLTG